jgi:cell division protein FtsB
MKAIILKLFTNKYFITILILIITISFFDRYDIKTQYQMRKELKELEATKTFYESEILKNKSTIYALQNDSIALEKFAREKYLMKKNNEEIFLVFEN